MLGRTLGKGSITVTWRRDVDFSLPSPSVRQKVLGNEAVADVQFTETYLPKVTLGKEFVEYFIRALNKAAVSGSVHCKEYPQSQKFILQW